MENITGLAIPAILSTGALLYKPQHIEFVVYGFVILFIIYNTLMKFAEKYNFHNIFKTLTLVLATLVAFSYLLKDMLFFQMTGFVYILFVIYFFSENLKEYAYGQDNFG